MQLRTLLIRFYKSFNHDYLRRTDHRVHPNEWDLVDGKFFPFVEIPIDGQITTVVGANESGKSHLLDAIERGISGQNIERRDFCRNSEFFTSAEGELRLPDFGFEWHFTSDAEREIFQQITNYPHKLNRFFFFRINREALIYLPSEAPPHTSDTRRFPLQPTQITQLLSILPSVFRLKADVALPDRVPLNELVKGRVGAEGRAAFIGKTRSRRVGEILENLSANQAKWFGGEIPFAQYQGEIQSYLGQLEQAMGQQADSLTQGEQKKEESAFNLAYDLLCGVAKVDKDHLADLDEALTLKGNDDGYAQSIVENINLLLDATFNFSSIWVQDREFRLAVTAGRDNDLIFTIRDRTGRNYSFAERSAGLKYFLSYYIQYLAHPSAKGDEILLMDEPDTFLSSRAQGDLLKIFQKFATPEQEAIEKRGRKPVQVIYVTHSPFLIDKNFAYRVRVLEKGAQLEGTRVVKDASIRHYEPLRTAFNGFYGETAYIGSCNLVVEGSGDQIMLAGAASLLNRYSPTETESLDLNSVTIVPCGGSGNMPHMITQAKGRDLVASPPLIVLLDSDDAGTRMKKTLQRGPLNVDKRFLFEVAELQNLSSSGSAPRAFLSATERSPLETEDLVPLALCVQATRFYAIEVCDAPRDLCLQLTQDLLRQHLTTENSIWDALEEALGELQSEDFPHGLHMEKAGFARYVIDVVTFLAAHKYKQTTNAAETSIRDLITVDEQEKADLEDALEQFSTNMKVLFRELGKKQRLAEDLRNQERISKQVDQEMRVFVRDWPGSASRERVRILFERLENKLTENEESEEIRKQLRILIGRYELNSEGTLTGEIYEKFKTELEAVRYASVVAAQGGSSGGPQPLLSHSDLPTQDAVASQIEEDVANSRSPAVVEDPTQPEPVKRSKTNSPPKGSTLEVESV